MANPEAMSKPDLALAAAGKKVGDEYADLFASMQAKIDDAETIKALDDFRNEQRNYVHEQQNIVGKNVLDVSNFTQSEADKGKDLATRATEWHTKLAETYANNLQSDRQKELFLKEVRTEIDQGLNQIASHQATQTRQYFVDQINYTIDTSIKDIQDNPSEDTVNRAKLKVATVVQALYPGQNVDEYKLHALNRIDTATKAIRENNIITQEIVGLKTKYAAQFPAEPEKAASAAIQEAESPEFIKRVGADKQRVIVSSLTTEWKRLDDAYRIKADEITGKLLQKLDERALTNDDIMNSGLRAADQARIISWRRTEERTDRAEARAARSERREALRDLRIEKAEKNEQIQGELYAKIANGEDVSTQDIYDQIPNGLLPTAARGLASDLQKIQKDPALKEGIKVIDAFAKHNGFDTDKDKNATARGKAITDLREIVTSQGLKGKAIIDAANEIIGPKKESWLKGVIDQLFYTPSYLNKLTEGLYSPQPGTGQTFIRTATNPKTGEKIGLTEDGKWIPIK
jgi:hypothetical protein